jgi:hypothetical protein
MNYDICFNYALSINPQEPLFWPALEHPPHPCLHRRQRTREEEKLMESSPWVFGGVGMRMIGAVAI